jgi:molybdopterin converting factor subunit 1
MTITIGYFAALREHAGISEEMVDTHAATIAELYEELRHRHGFALLPRQLAVAVNDRFSTFDAAVKPGDYVVFIPPVAGG